jgi:hypothetical protein
MAMAGADPTEFKYLLELVDRKVQRSIPATAQYWRGCCQGIKEYFHHIMEESARDLHAVVGA